MRFPNYMIQLHPRNAKPEGWLISRGLFSGMTRPFRSWESLYSAQYMMSRAFTTRPFSSNAPDKEPHPAKYSQASHFCRGQLSRTNP